MIAWLAGRLIAAKVGERWARPIAWAIAIVGAALLIWGAWSLLKNSIITAHDNEVRAEAAEQQLEREAEADGDQLNRQAADDAKADQLQGVYENAVDRDPQGGNAAVGPGTGAVLGELWRRQEGGAQPR